MIDVLIIDKIELTDGLVGKTEQKIRESCRQDRGQSDRV